MVDFAYGWRTTLRIYRGDPEIFATLASPADDLDFVEVERHRGSEQRGGPSASFDNLATH